MDHVPRNSNYCKTLPDEILLLQINSCMRWMSSYFYDHISSHCVHSAYYLHQIVYSRSVPANSFHDCVRSKRKCGLKRLRNNWLRSSGFDLCSSLSASCVRCLYLVCHGGMWCVYVAVVPLRCF